MKETDEAFYSLAPHLIDVDVDEKGEREYGGRRLLFVDSNVFAKIFDDMEKVAGPVINSQIKGFGKSAGARIGRKMDEEFLEVSKREVIKIIWKSRFDIPSVRAIRSTDTLSQFEKVLGYGRYAGWMGETEVTNYEEGQKVTVEVNNTFESYSYGKTGEKECKFLTGVIEGLIDHFWQAEDIESEEIRCSCESLESDKCVFQVRSVES